MTFVDSDKDVVSGVIRREVNGELRAEYEANEARIQAEIDRRAKEEEAKLMKMTKQLKMMQTQNKDKLLLTFCAIKK